MLKTMEEHQLQQAWRNQLLNKGFLQWIPCFLTHSLWRNSTFPFYPPSTNCNTSLIICQVERRRCLSLLRGCSALLSSCCLTSEKPNPQFYGWLILFFPTTRLLFMAATSTQRRRYRSVPPLPEVLGVLLWRPYSRGIFRSSLRSRQSILFRCTVWLSTG